MGKIIELSQHISNQIAAGEVVERPVSVVKELVENALDAGSTAIEVRIKDGGFSYLVVQDDGSGMDHEDVSLAIKRYATSKISSAHDLHSLTSFGFRGEALPSIASISNLTIISRLHEAAYGTKAIINAGTLTDIAKTGSNPGTRIEVRDLFFNVPARLKFAKSNRAEASAIDKLLRSFAFIHPRLAWKFFNDDRLIFSYVACDEGDASRAIAMLGRDTEGYVYRLDHATDLVRVRGAICAPMVTRSDARSINIFVNQRLVNDRKLIGAVKSSFRTLLEVGKSPICAISIEIAPDQVDVNVHPRKAEVRFADERRVISHIIRLMADFLSQTPWLRSELPPVFSSTPSYFRAEPERARSNYDFLLKSPEIIHSDKKLLPTKKFSDLRVIGQVQTTYLLLESDDGLVVIDQHAAHERVTFERLRAQKNQQLASSPLLMPLTIELDFADLALALDHADDLWRLGFETEPFGDKILLLRAVPDVISKQDAVTVFKDVLSELSEHGRSASLDQIYDHVCASIACHGSIRAGQRLNKEEIDALLLELDAIDFGAHCPHGRPVVKSFAESEIKKWFDRT